MNGTFFTSAWELLAVVTGLVYVLLVMRQRRFGWVFGGISSALYVFISWAAHLPLQAALQLFYVAMSVYGWLRWRREELTGQARIASWSWQRHGMLLLAAGGVALLLARPLAEASGSAWPWLDSLNTTASLLATWLVARMVLENWLYWLVIDASSVFLFYMQGNQATACLFLFYMAVAGAGYYSWRKLYRAQPH